MKKLLSVVVLTVLMVSAMNAQNIGLRFLWGAEISYQHPLDANRLELGLGLTGYTGAFVLSGTYQWIRPIDSNFNFYYGVGSGIGVYDQAFSLSGLGQAGIEYNFDAIPLQLSLDWRPALTFIFYKDGATSVFYPQGIGIGARFRF